MNPEVIQSLIKERSQLERELREDPRHQKIEAIDDLLDLYGVDAVKGAEVPTVADDKGSEEGKQEQKHGELNGKKPATKAERIQSEIVRLLKQAPNTHRKEILSHLTQCGLMGHEKDPMQSLAIFLSTHKQYFAGDGTGRFSLTKQGRDAAQQEFSLELSP
jgi:hypothetical protein